MRNFFIVIFLSFISALNCYIKDAHSNLGEINNDTSFISRLIQLHSKINYDLSFYYIKGLSGRPIYLTSDSSLKIFSNEPILLMEPNNDQTPYYVKPGDDITVIKKNNEIVFQTSDSIRNHELSFFASLLTSTGSLRYLNTNTYLKNTINLKQRDSLIERKHIERDRFLLDYIHHYIISDEFKTYIKNSFQFITIHEKLYLYYPGYNKKKIVNYYRDSISHYLSICESDANLTNSFYLDALIQISRAFIKEESTIPYVFYSKLSDKDLLKICDSASLKLNGKSKQFVISNIITNYVSKVGLFDTNKLKPYIDQVTDSTYKTIINRKLASLFNSKIIPDLSLQILFKPDGKSVSWDELIKKNSAQISYVDFWASWCKPCVAEIPFSKDLQLYFANKNIQFIYLSLDENKESWLSAIDNFSLSKNSFIVDDEFQSNLARKLQISSIPRYVILDGEGKIIDGNAPNPSDKNLIPLLEKYLKK